MARENGNERGRACDMSVGKRVCMNEKTPMDEMVNTSMQGRLVCCPNVVRRREARGARAVSENDRIDICTKKSGSCSCSCSCSEFDSGGLVLVVYFSVHALGGESGKGRCQEYERGYPDRSKKEARDCKRDARV